LATPFGTKDYLAVEAVSREPISHGNREIYSEFRSFVAYMAARSSSKAKKAGASVCKFPLGQTGISICLICEFALAGSEHFRAMPGERASDHRTDPRRPYDRVRSSPASP
jgi:hypothetical protein